MKILIYNDEGVSALSLQETVKAFENRFLSIDVIDHRYLSEEDWESETLLLIIPGGRDIPYDRKLKGKGTSKIRKFVENGGNFLGICAGAYFASAEIIFEKESPIEVIAKRELAFFPGKAIGTLYSDLTPFEYHSSSGSHAAQISFEDTIVNTYYKGGCFFEDAENYPEVSILSRYKDVSDQPAIIHCRVGRGNAILSGVHFEISPESLASEGCHFELIDLLRESDSKRESLIESLIRIFSKEVPS